MNEQTRVTLPFRHSLFDHPDTTLAEHAEHIRGMVSVARASIVGVGLELIAAKSKVAVGGWEDWLRREFDWSQNTATRYMRVADAFAKSTTLIDLAGVSIDATAFYALSSPDVPQQTRDEAVERAKAGEHITKEAAERMVKEAASEAAEKAVEAERKAAAKKIAELEQQAAQLSEEIAAAREHARADNDAAVEEAREALQELTEAFNALQAERSALQAKMDDPDDAMILRLIAKVAGRAKPSRLTLVSVASALGRPIEYGDKTYSPAGEAEIAAMRREKAASDEKLRELFDPNGPSMRWHRALTALRSINDLDSVEALFAARDRRFDHAFAEVLPKAAAWVKEFTGRMNDADQSAKPDTKHVRSSEREDDGHARESAGARKGRRLRDK